MKKLLVLTLTALTIVGLVGCKGNESKTEGNKNSAQIEQLEGDKESTEQEDQLAKVKSIIGNEISVNLSDKKTDDLSIADSLYANRCYELSDAQKAAIESGSITQFEEGNTVGEAPENSEYNPDEDPAISDEEVQQMIDEGTAFIDGENQDDFKDISFDSGSKDFTISAGVDIVNGKTGKDGKLPDIKEGTILSIITDKKTNAVIQIRILN